MPNSNPNTSSKSAGHCLHDDRCGSFRFARLDRKPILRRAFICSKECECKKRRVQHWTGEVHVALAFDWLQAHRWAALSLSTTDRLCRAPDLRRHHDSAFQSGPRRLRSGCGNVAGCHVTAMTYFRSAPTECDIRSGPGSRGPSTTEDRAAFFGRGKWLNTFLCGHLPFWAWFGRGTVA